MSDAHQPLPFLREALLFLTLAGLLMPLLQRLRINQVLGFLAVGALLGPQGLGRLADTRPWAAWISFPEPAAMAPLAELGILFLLFTIGLELSIERLVALRRWVFGAGGSQVLLSAAIIGGLAFVFGNPPANALVLGLVLALSSTAVVMQLLTASKALGTPMGQAVFSILLLQDLAVVPVLVLVDTLGARGGGHPVAALGWATLKAVIAISLIYLVGRRLLRPVVRAQLRAWQPDVFVALTLLVTLGIAGLTWMAGLSMALGAFLAGVLLAETEYRHEVEVTVEPFKGLLMGLFFLSVGLSVDMGALLAQPLRVLASVAGLMLLKGLVAALVLRAGGLSPGRSLEGGLLLGQGGEFAFIVVGAAMTSGLMARDTGRFMELVVALGMFATPVVARLACRLGNRIDRGRALARDALPDDPVDVSLSGHVLVAGCGRVGRLVGELLAGRGVPYVAVETNPQLVARLRRDGLPVFYGNATRAELLHRLHAGRAAAIVLTMDHPAQALHAVQAIRRAFPAVPLHVRARDETHAAALLAAGATAVIPETLEAGLQLGARVLDSLGLSAAHVAALLDAERRARIAATQPPAS